MTFDSALSVRSAVAWISALTIDAGFGVGTFAVADTASSWWWNDLATFTAGVGHIKFRTRADHGADRK